MVPEDMPIGIETGLVGGIFFLAYQSLDGLRQDILNIERCLRLFKEILDTFVTRPKTP